jgi:hydrogenase expression/formation protein HypC
VLIPHRLPPNDGGIALGQLLFATGSGDEKAEEETDMCLAVPGQVVSVETRDDTRMAEGDFGGVRKDVCLEYLPDVDAGDYVIVHVGFRDPALDEQSAPGHAGPTSRGSGVLEEEFGDGFALAAKQAGMEVPS